MRVGRVKRPGPPPEAGWSTTELTGEEQEEKDCGSDRVKRPDPSLTAGGSTTELTEEEKDCGFDRVKRPDPSLTAGGSTTELTESAGSGRGTDDGRCVMAWNFYRNFTISDKFDSIEANRYCSGSKTNSGYTPQPNCGTTGQQKNHFLKSCLLRRDWRRQQLERTSSEK